MSEAADKPRSKAPWIAGGCCGLVVLALLCGTGLGVELMQSSKAAEPVVAKFAKLLDAEDYQGAYRAAHPVMRQTVPFDRFQGLMRVYRKKLGDMTKREFRHVRVQSLPSGAETTVTYAVTWEKATGTLRAVLRKDSGRLKIAGWHFNSEALLDALINTATPAPSAAAPNGTATPTPEGTAR